MQVIRSNVDSFHDARPDQERLPAPHNFARIAVVCEAGLPAGALSPGTPPGEFALVAARLAEDDLVRFDYFPAMFAGVSAPAALNHAFDQIARQHCRHAYDLIAVVGGAGVEADIGCIHQILAPRMASSGIPVFTALGSDDAETVLGDTASRAFKSPEALIGFIAGQVDARHPPAAQLIARMQSVAVFLLAEQEVATTIQLQSGLLPVLQLRLDEQVIRGVRAGTALCRVAVHLTTRLARDEAALQQLHRQIATQIARLAQTTHIARHVPEVASAEASAVQPTVAPAIQSLKQHAGTGIGLTRLGFGILYTMLIALLWWLTTPANVVFFGGCGLVLMSAIYVAVTNRILDAHDIRYQQAVRQQVLQDRNANGNGPSDPKAGIAVNERGDRDDQNHGDASLHPSQAVPNQTKERRFE